MAATYQEISDLIDERFPDNVIGTIDAEDLRTTLKEIAFHFYEDSSHGWSPVFAPVADGSRVVLQVIDFTGGYGTKPAPLQYAGTFGLVDDIADAASFAGIAVNLNRSSTTSLAIGSGSKTFTTTTDTAGTGWMIGARLQAYHDSTHLMSGLITAVSANSVTITVDYSQGTGTYASWNLGLVTQTARGFIYRGTWTTGTAYEVDNLVTLNGTTYRVNTNHVAGGSFTSGYFDVLAQAGTSPLAYTTTTANFTQPAVNSSVSVEVASTLWMAAGQTVYVVGGGYYQVSSVTDGDTVVLINKGYTGNASPASTINAGAKIVAGGIAGADGNNGLNADVTRTSTTSLAIGSGSKTLTYISSINLGWGVGTRLRVYYDASNYMEGPVTAVTGTSVTIVVDLTAGSGTYAAWTISIAGQPSLVAWNNITASATTGTGTVACGSNALNVCDITTTGNLTANITGSGRQRLTLKVTLGGAHTLALQYNGLSSAVKLPGDVAQSGAFSTVSGSVYIFECVADGTTLEVIDFVSRAASLPSRRIVTVASMATSYTLDLSQADDTLVFATLTGNITAGNFLVVGAARGKTFYLEATQGGAGGFSIVFPTSSPAMKFPTPVSWNTTVGLVNTFAGVCSSASVIFCNTNKYS